MSFGAVEGMSISAPTRYTGDDLRTLVVLDGKETVVDESYPTNNSTPTVKARRRGVLALAAILVVFQACSDPPGEGADTGPSDTTTADTAPADTAATDTEATDTGTTDTAVPDTGSDTASDGASTTVDLRIDGLSAPVEVRFDAAGVLHLTCETSFDCYRAQGYFHAQHRFFAMDLIRRRTLGELARVFGSRALETDKKFRHFMTTRDGEPLEEVFFEGIDEKAKRMFRAYTAGVNAWIGDMRNGENGATTTEEYEFPLVDKESIRDWKPTDSVALYLQISYQLGQKSEDDLFRGRTVSELPPAMASDLVTPKPGVESNIIQAAGASPQEAMSGSLEPGRSDVAQMERLRERLQPAGRALRRAHRRLAGGADIQFGPHPGGGSNNWAVAGRRTKSGAALMANDPHLTMNNPSLWYNVEMHVDANDDDLHVAGASVPSVPGVVIGHNEEIAWGITTARYDLADAYVETITDDGDAVMYEGKRVPLTRKEFTFEVAGGNAETVTMEWVPHHGPLISKDVANNRGVSVRWVAQEGGNDLEFIQPLMRAESLDEARQSLNAINNINACWVLASTEGNIGWYPEAKLPNRPWASTSPNWLPLPGRGEAEWDGFVDRETLPELTNPPKGVIATANNDFDGSYSDGDTGNDGHTPWQSPPAYGHRHQRIVDRLADGGDQHTVETMADIQADTYSLHGEKLVPEVVEAADKQSDQLSEGARAVLGTLKDWNYTCPTGLDGDDPTEAGAVDDAAETNGAIGCAAFHVLVPYLTDAMFGDELGEHTDLDAAAHWYKFQAPLLYVFRSPDELENGDAYTDDVTTDGTIESEADVVREALETAADKLESAFGSSTPDEWRWGRIHTLTLRSFFADAGIDNYNYGTFATDGGFGTVDVAPPPGRDGNFDDGYGQRVGASYRIIVEAGDDGVEARFQLPGGQDLHRDSRWYNSLLTDWLHDDSTELLFEPTDVKQGAVESLVAGPAE